MRSYEVTFIVDPVLSGAEITSTANTYKDLIKGEGGEIVHTDEMGLKQLAYPIKRRNTGVYFSVEYRVGETNFIDKMELALRRDERIMRFLTVKLDKYGVKYNDDKRKGLIGKVKKKENEDNKESVGGRKSPPVPKPSAPAPEPKAASSEEE